MLDVNKLKEGNEVTFGEEVTKRVTFIRKYSDGVTSVNFDDGTELNKNDALWRIARLGKARLPELESGFVVNTEKYQYFCDGVKYTPGEFLNRLKEDVARLEAAGVKVAVDKSLTELLGGN